MNALETMSDAEFSAEIIQLIPKALHLLERLERFPGPRGETLVCAAIVLGLEAGNEGAHTEEAFVAYITRVLRSSFRYGQSFQVEIEAGEARP